MTFHVEVSTTCLDEWFLNLATSSFAFVSKRVLLYNFLYYLEMNTQRKRSFARIQSFFDKEKLVTDIILSIITSLL